MAATASARAGKSGPDGVWGEGPIEARPLAYDKLGPARRQRKKELLAQADKALQSARLAAAGEYEGAHAKTTGDGDAGADLVGHLSQDAGVDWPQTESGPERGSEDSDEEIDFEDLVRLYGPLEPLKQGRRHARAHVPGRDTDNMPLKGKYNVFMTLILMVLVGGLLAAIYAQARAQELWLNRQRQQCDQTLAEAVRSERGKVAGQWVELERRKWRQEFDMQIKRTRDDAAAECTRSQRACRRDIATCNQTVADLKHRCDSKGEGLRKQGTGTSESSIPSPPAPLLPRGVFGGSAIERSCAYDERGAMTLAQECTSWCSQQRDIVCAKGEQRDARQDGNVEHIQRHKGDQCGDAIGQAVASERKRLQDSAVKARRRAIEKMLDGDRESAAAQIASIICVTKEECNMERVIAEAIDEGRRQMQSAFLCGLKETCDPGPALDTALHAYWHRVSKCVFDGTCSAPEVLAQELRIDREKMWRQVYSWVMHLQAEEDRAKDQQAEEEGVERGLGGESLEAAEKMEKVRAAVQILLQNARASEERRVRKRIEAEYQQMVLERIDSARRHEKGLAEVREGRAVAEVEHRLLEKIRDLKGVIAEQERELQRIRAEGR